MNEANGPDVQHGDAQAAADRESLTANVDPVGSTVEPPTTFGGTLTRLGPGLIVAASIVGSGELIATTKTGAQAGFTALWLILLGCVIKVFVQVELGRFTLSSGETCLRGLNRVPGPRLGGMNWVGWGWALMMAFGLGQLGGIVGGVGQSLALTIPFTGDYLAAIASGQQLDTYDQKIWAVIVTFVTIAMLVRGRYQTVQDVSTILVASFTFITLGNVIALQFAPEWRMTWADLEEGFAGRLPTGTALTTALATFGIIGVGSNELIAYPYWCLEKGYARFTGPRTASDAWARRATGWMRVMWIDALLCMVIYTIATVAFYILGAAVLRRLPESDPQGMRMIVVLTQAYVPVFGNYARWLFLSGAFAVLYSTFFVANAGHARITADALSMTGWVKAETPESYNNSVAVLCIAFPLISLATYLTGTDPVTLVLASGIMQALMLPVLSGAAIYCQHRHTDPRLKPGKWWNIFLWLSFAGMLVSSVILAYITVQKWVGS